MTAIQLAVHEEEPHDMRLSDSDVWDRLFRTRPETNDATPSSPGKMPKLRGSTSAPAGRYSKALTNTTADSSKLPCLQAPQKYKLRPATVGTLNGSISPKKGASLYSTINGLDRVIKTRERTHVGVADWKNDPQLTSWYQEMLVRKKEEKARTARKSQKEDEKVMRMIEGQMMREEMQRMRSEKIDEMLKLKAKMGPRLEKQKTFNLRHVGIGMGGGIALLKRSDTMKSEATNASSQSPVDAPEAAVKVQEVEVKDDADEEVDLHSPAAATSCLQWQPIDMPSVGHNRVKEIAVWVNPGVFHTKKVAF